MSHTRAIDIDARVVEQVARGRHIRNIASQSYDIANARTNNTAPNSIMADIIPGEAFTKGIFVAPSDIKVVDIMANGAPWPVTASGGFIMLQIYDQGRRLGTSSGLQIGGSAVSGFVTALNSGVTYDLSLVSGDQNIVSAGQAIYSTVTADSVVIQSGPGMVTVSVEWIPFDIPSTML